MKKNLKTIFWMLSNIRLWGALKELFEQDLARRKREYDQFNSFKQ